MRINFKCIAVALLKAINANSYSSRNGGVAMQIGANEPTNVSEYGYKSTTAENHE